MIIAIDPGSARSAYVRWDGSTISHAEIAENETVKAALAAGLMNGDEMHIEMVACYGMPVGAEVFETCVWIGRFCEAWLQWRRMEAFRTKRHAIKLHHCLNARAKDSNIRQALIDKYGAPGTKKAPGVTYGLSKDLWQAFALATYATETHVHRVDGRLIPIETE